MSQAPERTSASLPSWWAAPGACLLLVAAFLRAWGQFVGHPLSFSSDHLYCLHFCDDVLRGRGLVGWHLPGAPYLFPDMCLLGAVRLLTSNVAVVFFLHAAAHYLLLLLALTWLFRGAGCSRRQAYTTAALGLALLLAVCSRPGYEVRNVLLFYPGNHMGAQLVGLAAAAFVLRALRSGYRWPSALSLVVVCGLCGLSDHLLLVQYLVPVASAALILGACRQVPFRRAAVTALVLGAAAGLALSKPVVLSRLGFVPLALRPSFRPPPAAAVRAFASAFWSAFHGQPLLFVALGFHLAGAAAVIAFSRRRPAEDQVAWPARFVALVLLLAPPCNVAAVLVSNVIRLDALDQYHTTLDQYLYTCVLLPFLCAGLWPRLLPWTWTRPLVAVAAVAAVVLSFVPPTSGPEGNPFRPRYPALARALDELARKHGRMRGFADFWCARELSYLTRERVAVLPVTSLGLPRFHAFNPGAFLDDGDGLTVPDYQFVIVPRGTGEGPRAEHVRSRYGEPDAVIPVGDQEIWRYPRLASRQLDLFLRAQLAQRLVGRRPFVGPTQPAALARPKRNLTPTGASGNVPVPAGESLALRFGQPVRGAMIDVAADFADEFRLSFYRAGQKQGEASVPAVAWNGADAAYGEPGLQSRLVAVPAGCRRAGFDEVHVTAVGRPHALTLGHFLVFDEWVPYRSGSGQPAGTEYFRYEGEELAHPAAGGVDVVADLAASGRRALRATDFQGCMAFGPYVPLGPGRYRADFALKVDDNASPDPVAALDACALGGRRCLETRPLRGRDFVAGNRYQTFSLTFEAEGPLELVEFRVFVGGTTGVTLDRIDVTRLGPAEADEVCEP